MAHSRPFLGHAGASAIVGTADIRRSSTDAIYEYTGAVICMVLIWTLSPGLNEAFGELLAEVLCHRRVAVDRHRVAAENWLAIDWQRLPVPQPQSGKSRFHLAAALKARCGQAKSEINAR